MHSNRRIFFVMFLVCMFVGLSARAHAQDFGVVFAFRSGEPASTPVQGRDGYLYGTAYGGENGCGSVYRMSTSGVGGTLFQFDGTAECGPIGGLTLATDGNFYGAAYGGTANLGALYRLTSDGAYTVLYNFQGLSDGANPTYTPIQASDGSLYGVTYGVYQQSPGTIYKFSSAGSVTTIFSLNMDGSQGTIFSSPVTQAVDSNLYVTTFEGGQFNCGTILKLTTAGELLSQYNFECKKNGESPQGALLQATDGNLYGTTALGGYVTKRCGDGCGTIYQLTPDGVVTLIHLFQEFDWWDAYGVSGGLVEGTDGNLYGVSAEGGDSYGTIYMSSTSGDETPIWGSSCASRGGGCIPETALMQDTNGTFYGTFTHGGAHEMGTLYSMDMGLDPFITFVQATGKAGGTAQILGQGLTGTTSVTFNGIAASSFQVNSDTSMTAVVPAAASTGPVVVTTPGGTLTSNISFRVSQ
jgi:uncharacterized repeat protein (TIGR03803 family)